MGDDQAVAGEGAFREPVVVEGKGVEGPGQLGVAPGRDGEDDLQPAIAPIRQGGQLADIVQAQEPPVGDQNHALDREALQDGRQHGLQRLRLGDVAGVDGVRSPLERH